MSVARVFLSRSQALGAALALALAAPVVAQTGPGSLVADRVEILADGRLVATGDVEALQGETRLTAERIVYDPETESLAIEGPIRVTGPDGAVIVAAAAELSTDLRDGLLRSARLVLNRELQLAANQIDRIEGRFSRLTRTTASSCEVCARNPVPLWQIRAASVLHDDVERQLYFRNARLELFGIPIFWAPRLRLPDPSLDRATGFLAPTIRTTDELGEGVKIPYFIAIGDNRDLTLTLYLATNRTVTLEARYRQAFARGEIELNGAVSQDDIRRDDIRAYLFAQGGFDLPRDYRLDFDLELTSDDTYLLDYDYSGKDRLDSAVSLRRVARDSLLAADLTAYRSLRSTEDNEIQPFLVGDAIWVRRFPVGGLGGIARLELQTHAHQRFSDTDVIGRDIGRITGLADWRRDWLGPAGIRLGFRTQLRFDHTFVEQDSSFPDDVTEITPSAAFELRWPWLGYGRSASHVIEPALMLAWTPNDGAPLPVDESTQLEFDEGNLFALSRFPAGDALERGLRFNLGLGYTRFDARGWAFSAQLGRTYRARDLGQFDGYSILEGSESDWITSLRLDLPENLSLATRALFDEDYDPTRNDFRIDWQSDAISLGGTYTWLRASDVEMRPDDTNEWRLNGSWQVDDRWKLSTDWRYDLRLDRSASAEVGIEYRTECARVDLAVRRRFTSSEDLRPTTQVTVQVALEGFGARSDGRPRPSRPGCRS